MHRLLNIVFIRWHIGGNCVGGSGENSPSHFIDAFLCCDSSRDYWLFILNINKITSSIIRKNYQENQNKYFHVLNHRILMVSMRDINCLIKFVILPYGIIWNNIFNQCKCRLYLGPCCVTSFPQDTLWLFAWCVCDRLGSKGGVLIIFHGELDHDGQRPFSFIKSDHDSQF